MISIHHFLQISVLLLLVCVSICNGRVIYVMAHAEKPGKEDDPALSRISSMDGLGNPEDGLGVTGMLRTSYMIDVFGRNAPYYRQPKKILTQHFVLQNNGNYINNGYRGHHTSRRMYHQTYALSLNLGINPDEEMCCGGSYVDVLSYIFTLPPEDDPVLYVGQHGVCDVLVRALSLSYGGDGGFHGHDFGQDSSKIWTLIDGELVEEWFMCTPAIPGSKCTDVSQKPSWVDGYKFPPYVPPKPLNAAVEYPSYIYTPGNIAGDIHWSYRTELRRRGVYFGEECLNEDIVKTQNANITVYN